MMLPGPMELAVGGLGLLVLVFTVAVCVAMLRDARGRGASDGVALAVAALGFLSFPAGPLLYFVLAWTGTLDSVFGGGSSARGGSLPSGTAAPEPGWYDNPEGAGQRWWDGSAWSEHVRQG